MAIPADNTSMAVFCDFENVALGVRDANYEKFDIKPILEHLLVKGSIVVKKAYCDWERYKAFKGTMHEANFELIEIPHLRMSGKNSADIRLVVDALDLCYTKAHVNTFVIISGDSDFSPLVSKLRENAKQVIGVGVKQSTSDLLIANCDEFIFYDDLVREQRAANRRERGTDNNNGARRNPEEEKRRKEDIERRHTQALTLINETLDALIAARGDSGKIWASVLKQAVKRRKPDFNESYYGFRSFGNLVEEAGRRGLLEFGRDEKSGLYVYRSDTSASLATQAMASPQSAAQTSTLPAESKATEAAILPDSSSTLETPRGSSPARSGSVPVQADPMAAATDNATSNVPIPVSAGLTNPAETSVSPNSSDPASTPLSSPQPPAEQTAKRKTPRPHKPARQRVKEARENNENRPAAEFRSITEQTVAASIQPTEQLTEQRTKTAATQRPSAEVTAPASTLADSASLPSSHTPLTPRKPARRSPAKPAASAAPAEQTAKASRAAGRAKADTPSSAPQGSIQGSAETEAALSSSGAETIAQAATKSTRAKKVSKDKPASQSGNTE